jgi:hypothetical protein
LLQQKKIVQKKKKMNRTRKIFLCNRDLATNTIILITIKTKYGKYIENIKSPVNNTITTEEK